MKIKPRITFRLLVFVMMLQFSGCQDSEELNQLREENKILKTELDSIYNRIENLNTRVVIMPYDNKIKLGEEYRAIVFLSSAESQSEPRANFYRVNSGIGRVDTLEFEGNDWMVEISFTPEDTGHYDMRGVLQQNLLGKSYEYLFLADFEVR